MKYTLKQLFEVIDEVKTENEFFYSLAEGDLGTDYYLDLITDFDPEKKVVITADGNSKKISNPDIEEQLIEVNGVLVYEFISHNEDFKITRVKNIDEAIEIMLSPSGLYNMFSGDILIIENGKRKMYVVKDKYGNIVTCDNIDNLCKNNPDNHISIEWL